MVILFGYKTPLYLDNKCIDEGFSKSLGNSFHYEKWIWSLYHRDVITDIFGTFWFLSLANATVIVAQSFRVVLLMLQKQYNKIVPMFVLSSQLLMGTYSPALISFKPPNLGQGKGTNSGNVPPRFRKTEKMQMRYSRSAWFRSD